MSNKLVTVIGGTGFVGKTLVNALIRDGYDVQVLARNASACKDMFPLSAGGGRLYLRNADVTQPKTLHDAFDGSWAVINLVGILYEKGRQRFSTIHTQCAERLAKMAKDAGAKRYIHMSALGINKAKGSRYAKSKETGEQAVTSAFAGATFMRPSVIFGAGDNFTNQFNRMASISPALPLIGGGNTTFQPIYVGDVADAFVAALRDESSQGKTYELGGPTVYSFRQILQRILKTTNRSRMMISIPWSLAKFMSFFAEFAPVPPLTRDQVQLLKTNNIVSKNGLVELGISPTSMEMMMPKYLRSGKKKTNFKPNQNFAA